MLSIITINLNNKIGLQETINSVASQISYKSFNFEFIVIDGDSKDGSVEVIKNNKIITKYIIEKDNGISEAFNKGIELSSGDYLFFLNSGDTFYNDNCLTLINRNLFQSDIIFFKIALVDHNKNIKLITKNEPNLNKQKFRNYLPHQGMIISKKLFDLVGYYNIIYKLGMDYEWSLRLIKNYEFTFKLIDYPLSRMALGGVSETNYQKVFIAYHKARVENKVFLPIVSIIISFFFIVRRFLGIKIRKLLHANK